MKKAQSYFVWVVCCSMTAWFCLISSPSATAQEKTSAVDRKATHVEFAAKKMTMADMVAVLGEQAGCAIIVDDEPIRKQADINLKGTVEEALDQIALAFDYTWTRSKQGVILMSKAFKNPKEMPQMNLLEMRQMAKRAIVTLSVFPCDPDPIQCNAQANMLFKSFSVEQSAQLQQGKHLSVKDLTLDQSGLLQQIVTNEVLAGAIGQWQALFDTLNSVPTGCVGYVDSEVNYNFWFFPIDHNASILLTGGWKKERQP